jgi:arsenate reductase (glutaredoxin)
LGTTILKGVAGRIMKDVILYWSPSCSTCQKAARWLDRRGVKVAKFRDIKDAPLTRAEVEALAKMLGGPEDLFSKRAVKYREMKLGEREVSPAEMLDLMTGEYTFLKRPIMVIGDKAIASFFERTFDSFLAENYFEGSQNRERQRKSFVHRGSRR